MLLCNSYYDIYSTMLTFGVQNMKLMAVTPAFSIFSRTVHYPCSDITSLMLCDVKMLVINIFSLVKASGMIVIEFVI